MADRIKALCVCMGGNTRSSTLARMLRRRGFEVLACGVNDSFSDDTLEMLFEWADVIYAQKEAGEKIKQRLYSAVLAWVLPKIDYRFDVGLDDWQVMDHPLLVQRFQQLLAGVGTGVR